MMAKEIKEITKTNERWIRITCKEIHAGNIYRKNG